jgi:hypothetical protein
VRASGPDFMFCAPGLIFGSTEGVGSRFHLLHSRTPFRQYRGRHVSFSCFALPDSFSTAPRAPSPVFMFCAPNSFLAVPRASDLIFMFCAPGFVFSDIEGSGSSFALLDSFSSVLSVGIHNAQIPLMLKLRKDRRTKIYFYLS